MTLILETFILEETMSQSIKSTNIIARKSNLWRLCLNKLQLPYDIVIKNKENNHFTISVNGSFMGNEFIKVMAKYIPKIPEEYIPLVEITPAIYDIIQKCIVYPRRMNTQYPWVKTTDSQAISTLRIITETKYFEDEIIPLELGYYDSILCIKNLSYKDVILNLVNNLTKYFLIEIGESFVDRAKYIVNNLGKKLLFCGAYVFEEDFFGVKLLEPEIFNKSFLLKQIKPQNSYFLEFSTNNIDELTLSAISLGYTVIKYNCLRTGIIESRIIVISNTPIISQEIISKVIKTKK